MQKKINVILLQNDSGEIEIIKRAFNKVNAYYRLEVFKNENEALDHFGMLAESVAGHNRPHIIIIDLDVPFINGPEILGRIKQDKIFRQIPIVIFSSAEDPKHIENIYSLYGNCYILKPKDHIEFEKAIELIWDFWSNTAALPGFDL
jgi:CheY-like chemotaxis protein